ncbi:MAG: (d)CMP kinase, partial [Clostridia bacterium]|nr:(d)CMP kinase [Clostridia bacterium]
MYETDCTACAVKNETNEPIEEKVFAVAIDGPASAGKSTVAKELASLFGLIHVDTGAMFRAIGLKALRLGIDPSDEAAVTPMLEDTVV